MSESYQERYNQSQEKRDYDKDMLRLFVKMEDEADRYKFKPKEDE